MCHYGEADLTPPADAGGRRSSERHTVGRSTRRNDASPTTFRGSARRAGARKPRKPHTTFVWGFPVKNQAMAGAKSLSPYGPMTARVSGRFSTSAATAEISSGVTASIRASTSSTASSSS